jgi:hypothetical protein
VVDALLDDRHGLEQDGEVADVLRDLVEERRRLDVVLRHVAVPAHDAALGVLPAAAHVVLAGLALRAFAARASNGGHDEIAGLPPGHLLADLLHDAKVFVAEDEELVPVRRLAVETVIDFGISSAQSHPDHLHGHLIRFQLRIGHVAHMNAVFLAGFYNDGFHGVLT